MKSLQDFYDEFGPNYARFEAGLEKPFASFPELAQLRREELDLMLRISSSCRRILYIGAGTGSHVLSLSQRGNVEITAIDFSPTMLNICEDKLRSHGIEFERRRLSRHQDPSLLSELEQQYNLLLIEADVRFIEWPLHQYQGAFCFCTLPLFGDRYWKKVLRELLIATGSVVVSIYNIDALPTLRRAYEVNGIKSELQGHSLRNSSGYEYVVISHKTLVEVVTRLGGKLVKHEFPAGRIYVCSSSERLSKSGTGQQMRPE